MNPDFGPGAKKVEQYKHVLIAQVLTQAPGYVLRLLNFNIATGIRSSAEQLTF